MVSSQCVQVQAVQIVKDGDCTRDSDRFGPCGLRLPAGRLRYRSLLTPAAGAKAQEGCSEPPS